MRSLMEADARALVGDGLFYGYEIWGCSCMVRLVGNLSGRAEEKIGLAYVNGAIFLSRC